MLLKRSRQEVDGTLAPHDGLGESSTKNELADDVLEGLWILENETKEKKKSFNWHPNWGIYRDFGFKTQITSITNCLMMPVKHLHSYPQVLWFDKATERLRRQRENLALARDQLQYFVEVAIGKNEEVAEEIETWLTKANDALDDVQILENEIKENKRCFFKKSPNWSWRYRLSKRVTKNRDDVTEAASEYQLVLHSATLSGRQFFKSEDHYMLFESPRSALNQIMEALEGDEFNKIVLCGIEGVGKTALVEQVETIAKNSPHFDNVVQAVVSQKEDIRDIQVQIAKSLGLEFEVPTIEGKREELRMRLNNKNILVILDDVWGELNLNEIGIPYVQNLMKCKILLATCREQLCNPGNYEKKVLLDGLTDAESWVLFKTVAGLTTTSMPDLQKVALEIVKKFNGWPIAITASAKELRGKPLDYWEAASKNVRGKTLEDWKVVSEKPERSEEDDIVYNSLKSSYDYFCLKQRENKLCFFLCYLFPEGSKIDVEDLMSCAIGLELHHSVKTIDEARSDTHATINILKDLNLLLGSGKMQFKMMEKIIRDVALSIASKEENFFIKSGVNLQEWPRNESFETCTAISMVSNKIKRLCDGFVSEKLKILLLTGDGCMRVSSKFFQGLKALKVLIFNDGILSLHALQNLTNLQTLHLKHCELCHIAELGKLKNQKK